MKTLHCFKECRVDKRTLNKRVLCTIIQQDIPDRIKYEKQI